MLEITYPIRTSAVVLLSPRPYRCIRLILGAREKKSAGVNKLTDNTWRRLDKQNDDHETKVARSWWRWWRPSVMLKVYSLSRDISLATLVRSNVAAITLRVVRSAHQLLLVNIKS
ncbi:hypothetical protein GWI33_006858 [Rhynchophorus ferrugineus]|uniref:Uncharacterized protein n=1 Tax=Rhynchophorus ferrugineus TaxID=354439 RepID=A0A834IKH9_RHYFE|nr:hypothetical protein GWI33_006858 [Rhynchophorus ferrugineus]